jgi:hypothetical protein
MIDIKKLLPVASKEDIINIPTLLSMIDIKNRPTLLSVASKEDIMNTSTLLSVVDIINIPGVITC